MNAKSITIQFSINLICFSIALFSFLNRALFYSHFRRWITEGKNLITSRIKYVQSVPVGLNWWAFKTYQHMRKLWCEMGNKTIWTQFRLQRNKRCCCMKQIVQSKIQSKQDGKNRLKKKRTWQVKDHRPTDKDRKKERGPYSAVQGSQRQRQVHKMRTRGTH